MLRMLKKHKPEESFLYLSWLTHCHWLCGGSQENSSIKHFERLKVNGNFSANKSVGQLTVKVKDKSLDWEWMVLIALPASVLIQWVLMVTDGNEQGGLSHSSICVLQLVRFFVWLWLSVHWCEIYPWWLNEMKNVWINQFNYSWDFVQAESCLLGILLSKGILHE